MFQIMLLLHPRWMPSSIASILKCFSSHYKLTIHVYNYLKKSGTDLRSCKFYQLFSRIFDVLKYLWNPHFTSDICWEESVFVKRKVVVMERAIWMISLFCFKGGLWIRSCCDSSKIATGPICLEPYVWIHVFLSNMFFLLYSCNNTLESFLHEINFSHAIACSLYNVMLIGNIYLLLCKIVKFNKLVI